MIRVRIIALILLPIVVLLGFSCKVYRGPADDFVNNWGPASVMYEIVFVLVGFLLAWPRFSIGCIAIGVGVATGIVELLQQWHPPWLERMRATFLGRSLLGDSFSWWDFPAYLVGCFLGWLLLAALQRCAAGDSAKLIS